MQTRLLCSMLLTCTCIYKYKLIENTRITDLAATYIRQVDCVERDLKALRDM